MANSRVEELRAKAQVAEHNVAKAKTREDALEAAITAAESYMQALRLTDDAAKKKDLDASCRDYLDRAEKIKNDADWRRAIRPPATASDPFLTRPVCARPLTTKEKIIVLEGSKLNGFVFPPWKEDPKPGEFELPDGAEPFEDVPKLELSDEQRDIFAGWKRPGEALSSISHGEVNRNISPTMSRSILPDLVQDATSDCSIVASLCAGTARVERGHSKLLSNILFPYDHQENYPTLSASGKYVLRLTFNGCERKVVIDDFLPASKTSQTLFVVDRNSPGLLWPALVEKAYLKVRGGYDFPGSNSGTDIATLSGWIPEQVFLHDDDVSPDHLWKRISNAFYHGDVLITIGTGVISDREQEQLGLAGEHDYAILDMRESDGIRELLIKNPWSDGDVWKGKEIQPLVNEWSTNNEGGLAPGTFWMDLGSVFQHFENLYLNWNPGLFTHREDIHFTWDLGQDPGSLDYFGTNPQFSISIANEGPVWLLLNKHFKSGEHTSKSSSPNGYISLYLFAKASGQRVFLSDSATQRGPFVDSPNTLLKTDIPKDTPDTVVIASQSLVPAKHNFTLSAFSRSPITLAPAINKYSHTLTKTSSWNPGSTAGGNSDSPTYTQNPQFNLLLPSPSSLVLILSSPKHTDIAIHAKILFVSYNLTTPTSTTNPTPRISTVRSRDILADTGPYRRSGAAVLETHLPTGSYVVIPSTFDPPSLPTDFTLTVSSTSSSLTLTGPLPSESAGRLSTVSAPATFPGGVNRMLAPLTTSRLVRAIVVARYTASQGRERTRRARAPLKVSVELGQGPYKTVLATTAAAGERDREFTEDLGMGVRIEGDLDLRREWDGNLWVVVERMGGGGGDGAVVGVVEVEVLAEGGRVGIGAWGVGDG